MSGGEVLNLNGHEKLEKEVVSAVRVGGGHVPISNSVTWPF